jgi:cytochrome P450
MTLAAHPDYVRRVMEDRWEIYPRSKVVRDYLRGVIGDGVFVAQGEDWRRQRRMLEPVLHGERVAQFADQIVHATDEMLERWHDGEEVDVGAEMTRLSLDVLERVLFGDGRSGHDAFAANVVTAVEYVIPRVMSPVNPPKFLPAGRRYEQALRELDRTLFSAISQRRREPRDDLVSMLIAARDPETGGEMSVRQVRDEVMTIIFGVYKGIPHALTWVWYLLSTNPHARERLRSELAEVLGGRAPGVGDLARLPYLTTVIQEALRLYPPLWIWSRPPIEDDEIAGYRIPAGMFVLMIPYVTHRHPDFWKNPEGFEPERFASDGPATRHPHAYFPFGSGPRRCLGESFALMQLRLVVASVSQRFRLELAPGYRIERALEFILRPKNGLPMRLRALAADRVQPDEATTVARAAGGAESAP